MAHARPPDFDRTDQKTCPAPIFFHPREKVGRKTPVICSLLHSPDSMNAPLRCYCAPSSPRLDNTRAVIHNFISSYFVIIWASAHAIGAMWCMNGYFGNRYSCSTSTTSILAIFKNYSDTIMYRPGRRLLPSDRPSARSSRRLTGIISLPSTTLRVSQLACGAFHDRISFSRWAVLARSPRATHAGRMLSGDIYRRHTS